MKLDRRLAVVCLFGGVVLLFAALGLFLVQEQVSASVSYSLIAAIALLVCYGLLAPTAVLDLVRTRQARFGSLSVFVSAVVIGVLVMANVIASRSTQTADLTSAHLYTLSPKSIAVLKQLDSDVTITGFFRPASDSTDLDAARSLLDQYRKASPHIKVAFVNPDTHPEEASRLGVTINGSFALQYRDRKPIVLNLGSQTEADFTSAILKLEANRTPQICWASGEGERKLSDTQVRGYSQARTQLGSDNFNLKEVILSQLAQIPSSCDILAMVDLEQKIPDQVASAVRRYLEGGGRLLLTVDPWSDADVVDSANALLKPYGASFDNGLVVEPDPARHSEGDNTTPVVLTYGDSPVTRGMANNFTFFPQSTAIMQRDTNGVTAVSLAQTTSGAYEVMTPRTPEQLNRRAGDKSGPFTMMETLEIAASPFVAPVPAGPSKGRIVLVGTSDFAANRALQAQAGYNLELLLGSFDWLAGNDQLIALPSKPPAASPLPLTEQDFNVNFVIVMLVLPLLVLLVGAAVYVRRRSSYSPA